MSTPQTAPPRARSGPTPLLLLLLAFVCTLEGYDTACFGVTVPSLLADHSLGLDTGTAGNIGSYTSMGGILGAALAANGVRRYGSRRVLLWGIALFTAGMLASSLAPGAGVLAAARAVVGIGLGVVMPTVTAYAAELSPPDRRSRNVGLMMTGYALGALASAPLGAVLLPEQSWRWIYVAGTVPAVVLMCVAPRFFPSTGRAEAAESGSSLRHLLQRGTLAVTLLFWGLSFFGLLLVLGVSTWLPTLMHESGYSLGSSLVQTTVMWAGAGVGMAAGGRVAAVIGIKPVVVIAFLSGAVGVVAISAGPPLWLLFVLMFLGGLGFIGSQSLTNTFVVTRYPEHLRGPGLGWALAVGRIGAVVGPSLTGWTLDSGLGVRWCFYLLALAGVCGAVLAACVPAVRTPQQVRGGAKAVRAEPA
ncbi:MFS transporter [Streptomyces sp. SID11385]|uniref:MFS transporter n=1 Tax=Streptomyces sp. SID11385 TaxID=2706031 RepID=UPI0013CD38DB|nr:MFS transporter [Streptomyces sp. SID11385]NEA42532.1 aromatic acid/H+ symport family MFS transporter [Streptomyces sp. SID11385]